MLQVLSNYQMSQYCAELYPTNTKEKVVRIMQNVAPVGCSVKLVQFEIGIIPLKYPDVLPKH